MNNVRSSYNGTKCQPSASSSARNQTIAVSTARITINRLLAATATNVAMYLGIAIGTIQNRFLQRFVQLRELLLSLRRRSVKESGALLLLQRGTIPNVVGNQ